MRGGLASETELFVPGAYENHFASENSANRVEQADNMPALLESQYFQVRPRFEGESRSVSKADSAKFLRKMPALLTFTLIAAEFGQRLWTAKIFATKALLAVFSYQSEGQNPDSRDSSEIEPRFFQIKAVLKHDRDC